MAVTIQDTADDKTKRFVIEQKISERDVSYSDSSEALASPVAAKIFGFPWTEKVRVADNFVEITRQDWVSWQVLAEPLQGLLEEHFSQYTAGPVEENPDNTKQKEAAELLKTPEAQQILVLLEEQINPALASHGGFASLHGVKDNKAYIEMGGGCQGCAMSYQTLKEGIETAIKQHIPSIVEVVDVTNHAAGDNPFY